jgi:hypothetical protein
MLACRKLPQNWGQIHDRNASLSHFCLPLHAPTKHYCCTNKLEEDVILESLVIRFHALLERRLEPRGVLHSGQHARI